MLLSPQTKFLCKTVSKVLGKMVVFSSTVPMFHLLLVPFLILFSILFSLTWDENHNIIRKTLLDYADSFLLGNSKCILSAY